MKKLLNFLFKSSLYVMFLSAIFGISYYGGYKYITPSSYISLNSNPSVKYSVNSYNRVLKVETDSEYEFSLHNLNLIHKDITDALELTIDELNNNGYLFQNEDDNLIISVSNKNEDKANSITEKLNNEIQIRYGEYVGEIKAILVFNE